MLRSVNVHPLRPRIDLDGVWEMQRGHGATPPRGGWTGRLALPGAWPAPGQALWLRRRFFVLGGGSYTLRVVAEDAGRSLRAWLDGRPLGTWHGAGAPGAGIIEDVAHGEHELVLLAEPEGRQGLSRSVYAEKLLAAAITDAEAVPVRARDGWALDCVARLRPGAHGLPRTLTVSIDGEPLGELPVGRTGAVAQRLTVPQAGGWSPRRPHLHEIAFDCGDDRWCTRVGFRVIDAAAGRLRLDGVPLALRGVLRPDCHPLFGAALPPALALDDLDRIRALGADLLWAPRPPDAVLLDRCDEVGLMVAIDLAGSDSDVPRALERVEDVVAEHRHHPALVLWSLPESDRTLVRAVRRRLRELDPGRPLALRAETIDDGLATQADVLCLGVPAGAEFVDWAREARRLARTAPVLAAVSAPGTPGLRGREDDGSEDDQAATLDELLAALRDEDWTAGVLISHLHDLPCPRSGFGHPHAGLLTADRRPKQAWDAVRTAFARR